MCLLSGLLTVKICEFVKEFAVLISHCRKEIFSWTAGLFFLRCLTMIYEVIKTYIALTIYQEFGIGVGLFMFINPSSFFVF